jgi:hypothetical protein
MWPVVSGSHTHADGCILCYAPDVHASGTSVWLCYNWSHVVSLLTSNTTVELVIVLLNCLEKTNEKQLTIQHCVKLWSIKMVLNTIQIIVQNCQSTKLIWLEFSNNATLLKIVMTPNKSQQRMSTSLEDPHSSTKGYNPNWIPTLFGQQKTQMDVCLSQWWSDPVCFSHCQLPIVDPSRQLFPWIHRSWGQQRGYIPKKDVQARWMSAICSTSYKKIDLV